MILGPAADQSIGGTEMPNEDTQKSAPVMFKRLLDAFEFSTFGLNDEFHAVINLDTGTVHSWTDMDLEDNDEALEDGKPADLDSSDRYLDLPSKYDLNLGRRLVFDFAEQEIPQHLDQISSIFHGRGAYRRFKDFLGARNLLECWYAFETHATEAALRAWCDAYEIKLIDTPGTGTPGADPSA